MALWSIIVRLRTLSDITREMKSMTLSHCNGAGKNKEAKCRGLTKLTMAVIVRHD